MPQLLIAINSNKEKRITRNFFDEWQKIQATDNDHKVLAEQIPIVL